MAAAEAKAFSPESKRSIKAKVDQLIERQMKPATLTRRGRRSGFGDVLELYTKWRGHHLVLFAKRRGGRVADRQVEVFETKSAG